MRNIGVIPWTVFNLLPFSPFSSQPWALLSLYQAPDLTFLYRAGQIELADSSAQSSLSWQFTLKPNWAGRRVCPELKPLAFQNTISQVENPNLSSVPGFHTGNCWQFSLQFSICLDPSPDSMLGTAGGSCGSPFYLELVHTPYSLGFAGLSLPQSKVPRKLVVHPGLSLGKDTVTFLGHWWSSKVHMFFCLVLKPWRLLHFWFLNKMFKK